MIRRPAVLVEPAELSSLFSALELWEKIRDGRLRSEQIPETVRQVRERDGGYKRLLRHHNDAGYHVCTTHQIVNATGHAIHWDEADVRSRAPEAEAFLAAGDSPYVFTAGTANVHAQAFFQAATEACVLGKRRGILLTRFPEQLPTCLPDSVRHFDYVPFSQVLPRAAAFVHHGGIGTMAQGFAAGIPQLVIPLAHDQFDNAMRARRLGCGDFLLPMKFTPHAAHEKLARLLGSDQVAASAKKWAAALKNTNTLERTCELIESLGSY